MQTTIEETRVVTTENGEELGEMTFVKSNDEFYIIDHTGVSDAARGRGGWASNGQNFRGICS